MAYEIFKLVFSSFWTFAGSFMFFAITLKTIFLCWNRFLRCLNIRSHGWPPNHVDADGDWKPEPEKERS